MTTNPCAEIPLGTPPEMSHLNPGFTLEWPRIRFLIERDGVEAAQEWCKNTMRIYRTAVLDRGDINRKAHYASTREFKHTFIISYLDFKRFESILGIK